MMLPINNPPPRPAPIATTTVPTPAKKAIEMRMARLPLSRGQRAGRSDVPRASYAQRKTEPAASVGACNAESEREGLKLDA